MAYGTRNIVVLCLLAFQHLELGGRSVFSFSSEQSIMVL